MALCLAEDVRSYFSPESLDDDDIDKIIAQVSDEYALDYGVSPDSADPHIKRACIHESTALTMRKAITTGELAKSVKSGSNYSVTNDIEANIQYHESQAQKFLMKFSLVDLGIVSGRTGVRGVNYEP